MQMVYVTFPAGELSAGGAFVVAEDDVEEPYDTTGNSFFVVHVDLAPYAAYRAFYSGRGNFILGFLSDNATAVSIAVADNTPDIGDNNEPVESTIEEGETAEFVLTRTGETDEELTVNVAIEDPGHFRRGNHWRDNPDSNVQVTFAADSATADLSVSTRDDWRDIPDNTITATIRPSQDNSYRRAFESEGATSAAVTVEDNDTAPQVTLSVSPAKIEEGATATFTIERTNAGNSLNLPALYGPLGEQESRALSLDSGESSLTLDLTPEDDD